MDNQLILILKRKIEDHSAFKNLTGEIQRNIIKQELQYYILNFIYHHMDYRQWTMYGGSALRICHALNRMSVDLDFEIKHPFTNKFLETVREDITKHFKDSYDLDSKFLNVKITNNRGLKLCFLIGDTLGLKHSSKQIHIKVDLNHFSFQKDNIATDRVPIYHDPLSFVIKTYNISTLMASKIAAIFLRGDRGIGKNIFGEKGRDIYDLLWYMDKKISPNLVYLTAKAPPLKNFKILFEQLSEKMNRVSDKNLQQDLLPLFENQNEIQNWLSQWRESYKILINTYKLQTVADLNQVVFYRDLLTRTCYISYDYATQEMGILKIVVTLIGAWLDSQHINFPFTDHTLESKIRPHESEDISNEVKMVVALFYEKIESYLNRTDRIVLGGSMISTKVIFTPIIAENLNRKEQIVLTYRELIKCEFYDLLK